jgi:two-component system LytT family response regulator
MKILIIEDELPAREKLIRYLQRYDEGIEILDQLTSVKSAVHWLRTNPDTADLILMDIQLNDGKSFSIFEQLEVNTPIIFTTAFDEYAIKAFDVNSLAYLLKPIAYDDLCIALDKYKKISKASGSPEAMHMSEVLKSLATGKSYKSRFMVKIGDHIRSVTTDQIMLFYADGRNAYIINTDERNLIIDYKMEELEELLDPKQFFRANRTFIISINGIKDVVVYSNSRLKIVPTVKLDKEIIVSREKVGAFKQWFDGN